MGYVAVVGVFAALHTYSSASKLMGLVGILLQTKRLPVLEQKP
jgi:hypothetical protein